MSDTTYTDYNPTELPESVVAYLESHRDKDHGRSAAQFTPDATVIDDGHTFEGITAIAGWLARASSEYRYTIEPVRQRVDDESHVVVVNHLEGNFPGGEVDLRHQFTLENGLISNLVIEV